MLTIIKTQWNVNREHLKGEITKFLNEKEYPCYQDLVELVFKEVYNYGLEDYNGVEAIKIDAITEIDNGDYQGTLLFLLPFDTCQPAEYEYLMTYADYGSCSGCDTLQSIMSDSNRERQEKDLLKLCEDILTNTIKPYNCGWREDLDYKEVEFKEEEKVKSYKEELLEF